MPGMGNIYDGAFRTIVNDCRKLVIPVINEVFKETYSGEEQVEFLPNEHFMEQQDTENKERITDTSFAILGRVRKTYHMECESSLPDGRMTIRLFEYDTQIALDGGEVTEEVLTVTFPHTAVLYLRTHKKKKTPDKMKYVINTPGGSVQYDVPVMKVQAYSLDDIFEKHLLLLLPFYIFSHEKNFPEYNSNEQKLKELKEEYRDILARLEDLEQQGIIGAFDKETIIKLSGDVIREITKNYENVQKVSDMMRGPMIETEARDILNQGRKEGMERGMKQGREAGEAKQIIEMGQEFGMDDASILKRIQDKTSLSLEQAMAYLKQYGKQLI